jgi:hypothetical protein
VFGGPLPSGYTWNLASAAQYDVRINGEGNSDELGTCVLTGDLTGDGIDELVLANEYFSQGLFTSEGAVHIFRGRTSWPSLINLATTQADITLLGDRDYDQLGAAAAVGDFNNDGVTDLAAAAPGADAGTWTNQRGDGFVYGLLGSSAYQTGAHLLDYATATPDFLLIGEFEENLGTRVGAGDFNGDGFTDIAAAERFAGPETNGVVEVLLGRPFSGNPIYTANVDTDLRIMGAAQDRIGFSLNVSNVNGDQEDEVLFGTPFNNGSPNAGTVYILTHIQGDLDADGDVDLDDYERWPRCMLGPDAPVSGNTCPRLDMDRDTDVDLRDFATFSRQFALSQQQGE